MSEPNLAEAIQSLTPQSLSRLITHIGLEDSGELLALASTAQIEKVLDEDLWTCASPGHPERFDDERFVLWLQVMLEIGDSFAAKKLEALPEDLVVLALHRNILVLNSDELRSQVNDDEDGDMTDKAIESSLYEEFDEYMVIARQHDGWDAIVAILSTLNSSNRAFLHRLLERCWAISQRFIDDEGGLYQVLTSDETLECDLAGGREDRRAEDGFIASTTAASFLNLARMQNPSTIAETRPDPIVRSYVENLSRSLTVEESTSASVKNPNALKLEILIAEITNEPARSRAPTQTLLGLGAASSEFGDAGLFREALNDIAENSPATHSRHLDELAFLCNALISGRPVMDRPFRPYESIVATTAICNLGLERVAPGEGGEWDLSLAIQMLNKHGADGIFRIGLSILHHDVAMFSLEKIANGIRCFSHQKNNQNLVKLSAAADLALKKNMPWQFTRQMTDLRGLCDSSDLDVVKNLLDEFPLLAQGLAQNSSGIFRIDNSHCFIATSSDINAARNYVEELVENSFAPAG